MKQLLYFNIFIFFLFISCQNQNPADVLDSSSKDITDSSKDWHTQSNADELALKHLDLDIKVNFDKKVIVGSATWYLDTNDQKIQILSLDTRNLQIDSVKYENEQAADFRLATPLPYLGSALHIEIKPYTKSVTIFYQTSKNATALQWLTAAQTSGKSAPFLYTQSESIYARTWIPCPDGPGIRFTYNAKVEVPTGLMALMSGENPQQKSIDGIYHFKMDQPIPAYLMALAVGDIAFKAIDERTGVYAEPDMLDKAYKEFEDVGKMVNTAEELYGPYRWGRYDILVLPSGFPLGGMENPRLTFSTPTILAGDKSLVNLIAHELAHSWSGNLVTNASWEDFWLNEGFTVYFERRITEATYGKDYTDMLWELGYQDLKATVEEMGESNKDTRLKLELKNRDPDIGLTDIAYEKGAAFLHLLEQTVGREQFDQFLRTYFDAHAFKTINTGGFLDYLQQHLIKDNTVWESAINAQEWVYGTGIPENFPKPELVRFHKVEDQIKSFSNNTAAGQLHTEAWSTYEWLHFLRNLPYPIPVQKMTDLDTTFHFSQTENSEIANIWYLQAIRSNYTIAFPEMKNFLYHTGRMKFLEPLFKALMETPNGERLAKDIYKNAKANYHPLAQKEIEDILYGKKK